MNNQEMKKRTKRQSKILNQKSNPLRLLVVEDSPQDAEIAVREIGRGDFDITWKRVETAETMGTALREETWDIIVCDYNMPNFNGVAAMALLKETGMDIPLIIVSGTIGEEVAVECMRQGAQDYIMKDSLSRLVPAIERELQEAESRRKRKQAESQREAALDALRESEEKYRTILEDIQEGYFEVDLAGNFTFFNDSLCKFFDYSKEELMGMNNRQYTDVEQSKKLFQAFNKVYNTGEPLEGFDWQIVRKDGTKKHVEASISLQKDSSGKPIGFRGIARDVTERKQAENMLHESERRYRSVFENTVMGISQALPDGRLIAANDAYAQMYGYANAEEMMAEASNVGQRYANPEDREEVLRILKENGVMEPREIDVVHRDGTRFTFLVSAREIRDPDGNLKYYQAEHIDVTDRKKAEDALRASEELFRNYLEYAPDGVYINELNGTFLYGNRKCEEIIGYKREELIGKNFLDLNILPEKSLNKALELLQENMNGKPTGPDEIELISKEGRLIPVEINTSVVRRSGDGIVLAFVRDITDRKQAEEALKESEKKYRLLADNIHDVIFVLDMNLKYTYVSPSVKTLRGYEPEEVLKQLPSEILTPSSLDLAMKGLAESLELEKTEHREVNRYQILQLEMRRKDGTTVWTEVMFSAIRNENQQPVGIIGVTRDITERKRSEDALRKSESNYKQLFDNAPSAIYQVDFRTGKFLKANDVICEYYGSSQEEITSLSPYDILTKESRILFLERLNKMTIGDKVPEEPEFEIVDKKGKHRWLKLNAKYIYDSEGLAGADVIAHDITERRQAEDALRESEEKYRNILEDMDDIYFEVDIKGNITFVNLSSCKMSGYSEDELIGMPFKKISAPDGIERIKQYFGEIFLTDKTGKPFLWNLVKKNGDKGFFELVASLIRDKQGKPIGFRGIGRDVTERKQAEAKLQKTLESLRKSFSTTVQVMASAVEVKDPYTAGHQLRVANLARVIATEMGLPPQIIEGIRMAGSIHDIGKLSVPAELLTKPTKLSDAEFSIIKEHAQTGYDMLKDVDSPWPLAQIVYQHHERMNGTGYPRKLKGDEILMEARIMAVADVVEAMASYRPYRPALGIDVALAEIEKNRETLYDKTVADVCLKLFREKGYQLT